MITAKEALAISQKNWDEQVKEYMEALEKEIKASACKGLTISSGPCFKETAHEYVKNAVIEKCKELGYQAKVIEYGLSPKKYFIRAEWG